MKKITNNKTIQKIVITTFIFITTLMPLFAQNTSLPVGAIPGAIDVSPTGATTYTIPIEVVPGTQGIQPNLSIVYNSMSGMGLLGMKWGLVGLSAITNCGQTPYYDDNITAIDFDELSNNNRFALDGERLININGDYGVDSTVYATEMENFMRVVSYGHETQIPIHLPVPPYQTYFTKYVTTHFTAYTDEGTVIEYGHTTDSKQQIGYEDYSVLSYYINKITDFNGNYMTYHYGGINGEIWIDSIKYTGNTAANITPYAKVEFGYTTLSDNMGKTTFFVGGYGIPQTKLLKTVTVKYGNTIVRKYTFNYNLDDSGERTAHLKEIVLSDENGTELNATTIEWGENTSQPLSGLPINFPNGKILTGDFNGDGYTDILLYNTVTTGKGYKMYLFNSVTNNYDLKITNNDKEYESSGLSTLLFAQDINGDGKDELIIGKKNDNTHYFNFYTLDGSSPIGNGTLSTSNFMGITFGDFDGDGGTDVLLYSCDTVKKEFFWTLKFYKRNNNNWDCLGTINDMKTTADLKIEIIDANGNGKKDILFCNIEKYAGDVYEYNNFDSEFYYIFVDYPVGTGMNPYEYGDVNGDGITDILVFFKENNEYKWKILIGKGNGTFQSYILNNNVLNTENNSSGLCPMYGVELIDINGDGKDDIIQAIYSNTQTTFKILLSNGWVNGAYKYSPKTIDVPDLCKFSSPYFSVGDFNGDASIDLLFHANHPPKTIYIDQVADYEFVKEITDGIGKEIKLNYLHQYFLVNNAIISCPFKKNFIPIVNSIEVCNGIGTELNSWQYQYNYPASSPNKRIFLGFMDFVCIHNQNNRKDVFWFTKNNTKEIILPSQQMSYYDNEKTMDKFYTVSVQNLAGNRFILKYDMIREFDIRSQTALQNCNYLNGVGRLTQSFTETYNHNAAGGDYALKSWTHKETSNYTYQTITLNGNQKKTVPTQILTTQQYGIIGVIIADTLTYDYSGTGLLNQKRQGNIDGSITTTYGNYTAAGLFQKKTVSAAGCEPRTETYTYDTKQRFVTQIKNPLNFSTNFTYYENTGNRKSETDINGLTTNYTYDSFGQLTKINYPDGTVTKDTVYWFSGSNLPNAKYCTQTTSTGKPDLTVYYDMLGREVCRLDDGYYYETRYNEKGQVTKTSFPFATFYSSDTVWNYYTYDNFGRQSNVTAPYTDLSYSYDIRKVTVTDHLRSNIQSYKDYDALGRIVQAHDEGGDVTYAYTVTNNKRHQTTITTNGATTTILSDLWGNRGSITEPNAGTITSFYNNFNELIKQTDANGNITSYKYDKLGRITKKIFSNSEMFEEEEGEDGNGLDTTRSTLSPITIRYFYDNYSTTNKGKGKISEITINNILEENFSYDTLSRLVKHIKNDCGGFTYTYTPNGQIETINYPGIHSSQLSVTYSYTPTGKLKDIRNSSDNSLIYKVDSRNKFGAPTFCGYGNLVATEYSYNPYGLLTRINTGNKLLIIEEEGYNQGLDTVINEIRGDSFTADSTILNYRYAYNAKGLMTARSESVINCSELFSYDNLDRLTGITTGAIGATGTLQTFSYHNNGNITNDTELGYYSYGIKPHAVTQIIPVNDKVISANECAVDYNFFNQPVQIEEGDYKLELSYDAHQQRKKTTLYKNDVREKWHTYYNKYCESEMDFTLDSLPVTHYYQYIYGDEGVVAMYRVTRTGRDTITTTYDSTIMRPAYGIDREAVYTDSMYYIHTDHLGSYCAITNAAKTVRQRNWFDPWGNYPIKYDTIWVRKPVPTIVEANFPLTPRGFTGHEHYPMFKIINMNGRLYDPVIARFFSPDKYVMNGSFTQDFNRYSYARNNPLMYTDPDGEWINFVIGAVVGFINGLSQGAAIANAKGATGWAKFGYMMAAAHIGAGIGAATAGLGTAITTSVGQAAFLGSGLVGQAVGATVSGAVSGAAFTGMAGGNPWDGLWKGAVSGLAGGLVGGSIGGGVGAFAGGFTSGATGAILNGASGKDILKSALIGGVLSYGAYEIQMGLSYSQYNKSGKPMGDLKYSGFHKISAAAQRSFAWGVESAGWITNDGTVGKIAYGGKDWVKMPDKPYNGIANFHTHPNSSSMYLQSHSPQDVRGETNVNYVIAQDNIYKHDPAIRSFSANLSLNYIRMVMPTSQGFNSYSNSLDLYPFFWFYFGQ